MFIFLGCVLYKFFSVCGDGCFFLRCERLGEVGLYEFFFGNIYGFILEVVGRFLGERILG